MHNTNLLFTAPIVPFHAGTTVDFEPIASIDGQGFFLEDMFLITKDGAQILTPGGPYSAEEIEAAMRSSCARGMAAGRYPLEPGHLSNPGDEVDRSDVMEEDGS